MKWPSYSIPWFTFLYALMLVVYLHFVHQPGLITFYKIPAQYLRPEYQQAVMAGFVVLVLFETFRLGMKKRRYDQCRQAYDQRLEELLTSRGKLQHKAHQYSDHADKLKQFIGDRLLEHIQYDEKFLHFKNIASEVRHNGVICYDKVNTSLRAAIDNRGDKDKYQEALDSMAYLWDLLDLSTTDNMAMYISNKLYESEEQYYQQILSEDESPFSPTFDMCQAVIKTLTPFVNKGDGGLPNIETGQTHYSFSDERFVVELDSVGALLGNENYVVLMLENLVNNALYYSELRKYSSQYSRIVVRLIRDEGNAKLTVYNRGPLINDEIKGQIFRLGYSTKRVRENNGKGLGLYFVHEIVKGYEGEINFINIINPAETYLIKITLVNGDEVTNSVIVDIDDKHRPMCRSPEDGMLSSDFRFKFKEGLAAVEVLHQSSQQSSRFTELERRDELLVDPVHPERPTWKLEIKQNKNGSRLTFKPLDIGGVQFNAYFPTADSRLDENYHDMSGAELDNLDELDKDFKNISQFMR